MDSIPGFSLRIALSIAQLGAVVLVLVWTGKYLKGFKFAAVATGQPSTTDTGQLFNWHPVLMVVAFPIIMSEGLLAYRSVYTKNLRRAQQKTVHVTMNAVALGLAALGVVVAWKSHSLKKPVPTPNLYSIHSWLGLFTLGLAACQAALGVVVYLFPRASAQGRASFYQYHAAIGGSTFVLAIATMLVGIQEKSSFMILIGHVGMYDPAIRVAAILGLLLVLIALLTGAQLLPGHIIEHNSGQGVTVEGNDCVEYECIL